MAALANRRRRGQRRVVVMVAGRSGQVGGCVGMGGDWGAIVINNNIL